MPIFRKSPLTGMPPVIKNLLIINVLLFLATQAFTSIDLTQMLGLYYPTSEYFKPYQVITHMFMHANLTHLFFNMFALWMFGRVLESVWGSKRFLIYYFVTGLGAVALHLFVSYLSVSHMQQAVIAFQNTPSPELFKAFINSNLGSPSNYVLNLVNRFFDNPQSLQLISEANNVVSEVVRFKINTPTIGASGAVFGVLLAFGMLFPNTELLLLFPPIPIKAKWMVLIYGVLELFLGIANFSGDNVAHFAHLGGALFGFFLILYWRKHPNISQS